MSHSFRLYNLLKETFLLLDFGDRQLFEQFHLSIPRTYALYHIASTPGISPSQLSERMFCDKSNITRLVQGLESDGLVIRRPHESDGRATCLHLTPAGAALAARVTVAHEQSVEARLQQVDCEAAVGLSTTLAQLNRQLAASLAASKIDSETRPVL
jgi:DNA-binding MarR family transcriptional regulator